MRNLGALVILLGGCGVAERSLSLISAGAEDMATGPKAAKAEVNDLAVLPDYLGMDPGPSQPEDFLSFSWTTKVGTCPSSSCSDFVDLKADCSARVQENQVARTATLGDADCLAFKKWVTSDRLLTALQDPVRFSDDPAKYESFGVNLNTRSFAKKTGQCPQEPYITVRGVIAQVRAKYFPR